MCTALGAGDLSFAGSGRDRWWLSAAAVLLWLLVVFHTVILFSALRRDMQMKKQGWWKDEYFLTRDEAHAQVLQHGFWAQACAALRALLRALKRGELQLWVSKWTGIFYVRVAAARALQITELDVRFMLSHLYQVNFADEESTWTRKRNADFLALQLKTQQAVAAAHGDFSNGSSSFLRRVCYLLWALQPYLRMFSFSLCTSSSMRALLVISNVFGRVGMSALYFLVSGTSRTHDSDCQYADFGNGVSTEIIRGMLLEFLFGFFSKLLHLIWTLVMSLFHSREFQQDFRWDAATRKKQVLSWWIKDSLFGALVLLYAFICCAWCALWFANAHSEDRHRWLVSFLTILFVLVVAGPLTSAMVCAAAASWSAKPKEQGGLQAEECMGLELSEGCSAEMAEPVETQSSVWHTHGDSDATRNGEAPPLPKLDTRPIVHPGTPASPNEAWLRAYAHADEHLGTSPFHLQTAQTYSSSFGASPGHTFTSSFGAEAPAQDAQKASSGSRQTFGAPSPKRVVKPTETGSWRRRAEDVSPVRGVSRPV
eukprot:TRINITY_DN42126_c0_g1_i1.p1 TRINITY_DN42126_c0_g1~~TRINITY_DN42126_c0_g1_i1.p1  ORF type:complete len:539 (+),score=63.61 TRINITY_DN42126_c0_g1_i1:74-1690(+)